MLLRSKPRVLPAEFLDWQVRLRRWTVQEKEGAPHVGVAPLLVVRRRGVGPGTTAHSIVCGLLPANGRLTARTQEMRELYERHRTDGARAIYDAGLDYLRGYYANAEDFDSTSITTILPSDAPAVDALGLQPRCALVFHVFDVTGDGVEGGVRCMQLNCTAEILHSGPVYENVWWHNALFHGSVSDHVVIRFAHRESLDTRFGGLTRV